MKILKIILVILLVVLVIYLGMCFMGPKKVDTTRSLEIDAPATMVYNQVAELKNWENWSPWKEKDPESKMTYGDKTRGVGSWYEWEGPETGAGKLEIIEADPGKSLKTQLTFKDWEGNSYGDWKFEPLAGGKTNVSWGMSGEEIPFFMRGMMTGMVKELNSSFDKGLANIAAVTQKIKAQPDEYKGFKVQKIQFKGGSYAHARAAISWEEIKGHFEENLPKIYGAASEQQVDMVTPPSGLYWSWDEENGRADMSAAIGVKSPVKGEGIKMINITGGAALLIDYYGAYEKAGDAHLAMDEYLKARYLTQREPVVEEYITDPTQEPDTSKWLTKIYYLVEE